MFLVIITRFLLRRASHGPCQRRSAEERLVCQTGSDRWSAAPARHQSWTSGGSTFPSARHPGWQELERQAQRTEYSSAVVLILSTFEFSLSLYRNIYTEFASNDQAEQFCLVRFIPLFHLLLLNVTFLFLHFFGKGLNLLQNPLHAISFKIDCIPSTDSFSIALRSPRLLWGGRVNPLMLRPVRTRLDRT